MCGRGRGEVCQLPAGQLDAHPVPSAWALTLTSALAGSMEQRGGPPEPRPAGPTTHPQPKVSPGLAGRDGWDHTSPSPAHGALSLLWDPWSELTPLCCALSQEGTLWGLLAILSLLAGLAAGTLRTPHCNETLDAAPTPRDTATVSPAVEDGVEVPLAAAWSHLYGACWGRTPQPGHGSPERGAWAGWEPLWGAPARAGLPLHIGAGLGVLNTWGPLLHAGDGGRALGMRRCLAGCPPTPPPCRHLASTMVGGQEGSTGRLSLRRAVGAG